MQQRHEEEQRLLVQLEEAAKLYRAEHAAQKARREVEEKAQEKAKRQKVVEKEERKRRMMMYLQWLWNKVLEEEVTLLEETEGSQVTGSKCKKIAPGDKEEQWSSKKAKGKQQGKYRRGATVKMGGTNTCERCVSTR